MFVWVWIWVRVCIHKLNWCNWPFAFWQFDASFLRDPVKVVMDLGEYLQIDWVFAKERQWFNLNVAGNTNERLVSRMEQWTACIWMRNFINIFYLNFKNIWNNSERFVLNFTWVTRKNGLSIVWVCANSRSEDVVRAGIPVAVIIAQRLQVCVSQNRVHSIEKNVSFAFTSGNNFDLAQMFATVGWQCCWPKVFGFIERLR